MKVEYINPFLNAAFSVLETVLGQKPVKGGLAMRANSSTNQMCNVFCGVTGQIEGMVVYGMNLATADKVASTMIGQPVFTFDQLAASAIAELANMISGNAMSNFAELGFSCDITPPSIIRCKDIMISSLRIPTLALPICLEQGEIEIILSLRQRA